jgi:quinol monooxygenase YgiN
VRRAWRWWLTCALACCRLVLLRVPDSVIVVLTLTVNDDAASKDGVLTILKELQAYAKSLPACMRFDIAHNVNNTDVLVSQTWATQQGLDSYYESAEFQRATPKFKGLLSAMPDERVFSPI